MKVYPLAGKRNFIASLSIEIDALTGNAQATESRFQKIKFPFGDFGI
ncbi:MAG: hypothetical protein M1292_12840 [Bacteroidetes bacterium]|nr:hypothetical protein [Bacteroidota bacterium]